MSTVEDRVRAALRAHAEDFSASPDAWQRIQAKATRRSRPRRGRPGAGWLARHRPLAIPAASAAVVVAIVLGAAVFAHEFAGPSGPSGSATHTLGPSRAVVHVPAGPAGQMLATDPAVSAIFSLKVSRDVKTWFWIGAPSPLYWFPYIATSREFCHYAVSTNGGASGDCWPLPQLSPAQPAVVISANDYVGTGSPVLSGAAAPEVTSVTAVFPDGQRFPGTVGTGRGFPVKAWTVTCPVVKGTRLVFSDGAGHVVANLSTAAPQGPIVLDLPQPKHGGITMFTYPASPGLTAGTVVAYLINGHVAFFGPDLFDGTFSPHAASAPPVVDGMVLPFGSTRGNPFAVAKAFGYAHGNVAKVIVRLSGGRGMTAITFPARWPGSDLRLWQISLPSSAWNAGEPKFIATAYDAAGRSLGQVQLGSPQI